MTNYSIRTDLLKLNGAFVTKIQGKTAAKACLCIPIEGSGLFLGKQGCYLNMTALEIQNPQYNDTHCIKVNFDKEVYNAMSEDERKSQQIIGGLHPMEIIQETIPITTVTQPVDDGLPF